MTEVKEKELWCVHLLLGLFFSISGLVALFQATYLVGFWVISLGLLFIFFTFQERLAQKMGRGKAKAIHIILALLVIATGSMALLKTFHIF